MATWQRVGSCTMRSRSWRRRHLLQYAVVASLHRPSAKRELPKPLLSQRPKQLEITTLLRSDHAHALVQINDLPLLLQHLQLNIRWEALLSPVFAERHITLNARGTEHCTRELRDVAASAHAEQVPRGVPLDQSTPWEYLGQLSSLSSLAITGPPDSAQTVTATGRSFQNLHIELERSRASCWAIAAGDAHHSQRSARTAVAQRRGNRLGERPGPNDTDSSASLSH